MKTLLFLFVSLTSLGRTVTGEYCSSIYSSSDVYCSSGCCGDYSDRYCCSMSSEGIAGTVIGLLIGAFFLFALMYYCYRRRHRAIPVIVGPAQPSVTVVSTQSGMMQGGYAPQQPVQPPPYGYQQPPPPQPQFQQ